ncbi:hypothetical protein RFI_25162 [Reticulomyxa filosa]|uniref:Uncharacterized protein n=1 Tax=Reticulomyxa filosa TaxID=46433 RepID=X6ME82_RETFI|nr:hypothetical protein RFI_25162 [Reticulomyxa filosa]|eukprot:ETO12214.1 hypothetical protein RFI_25162 [Reticulomyxa filosa]
MNEILLFCQSTVLSIKYNENKTLFVMIFYHYEAMNMFMSMIASYLLINICYVKFGLNILYIIGGIMKKKDELRKTMKILNIFKDVGKQQTISGKIKVCDYSGSFQDYSHIPMMYYYFIINYI